MAEADPLRRTHSVSRSLAGFATSELWAKNMLDGSDIPARHQVQLSDDGTHELITFDGAPAMKLKRDPSHAVFGASDSQMTFRVMDILEHQKLMRGATRILDFGCGTGAQGIRAGQLGSESTELIDFLDLNPFAPELAAGNARRHLPDIAIQGVVSDGWTSLPHGAKYDRIIAMIPTARERETSKSGEKPTVRAYNEAGPEGRDLLDSFLTKAGSYLTEGGRAYFVAFTLTDFAVTAGLMNMYWGHGGWSVIACEDIPLTREGALLNQDEILADYAKAYALDPSTVSAIPGIRSDLPRYAKGNDGRWCTTWFLIEATKRRDVCDGAVHRGFPLGAGEAG